MDTKTLFDPEFTKDDSRKLLLAARERTRQMDALDAKSGTATPSQCPLDVHLRTVISSLNVAINLGDWAIAAEAYCMLQDAELRERLMIHKWGG